MQTEAFIRYLASKKEIDDRSLNAAVWQKLVEILPPGSSEMPLRVLEVGAGIGTMMERLMERGVVPYAVYTALDAQAELLQAGQCRLIEWAQPRNLSVQIAENRLALHGDRLDVQVRFVAQDLFHWLKEDQPPGGYDLLIAHAFLDLVDLDETLPPLFQQLRPGGVFYFTLTFDGLTVLEPPIEPEFDGMVIAGYHQTMDERIVDGRRSGGSASGRKLFAAVERAGGILLQAGASDWVVFPKAGKYEQAEIIFLRAILDMIAGALQGHPALDKPRFQDWMQTRYRQLEKGELIYIAHQLDMVGIKGK
ncbi:MAG: class I SAM-dependent methyltransferase [Chloroflexota bacterium]